MIETARRPVRIETSLEDPDDLAPDIAWIYRTPLPDSQKIAGLLGFSNERVDIVVDGVLLDRPRSHVG